MTKKEYLHEYIDAMDNKDIDFLYELFHIDNHMSKDSLIELFGDGTINTKKMDSAYPIEYFRKIQDLYPDAKNGAYIFDYTKNNFGELVNFNNIIANKVLSFFNDIFLNL